MKAKLFFSVWVRVPYHYKESREVGALVGAVRKYLGPKWRGGKQFYNRVEGTWDMQFIHDGYEDDIREGDRDWENTVLQ